MKFIPLTSLIIAPNRQRAAHDPALHQELIASIETNGLLSPVVTRNEGGTTVLVAGERRLRAVTEIHELGGTIRCGVLSVPPGCIPSLDFGELTPLEAEEAEYEENVRRVDLSWQERALAEDKLLRLRQRIAIVKGLPPPTIGDIAKDSRGIATASAMTSVTSNIILARNLHRPEVIAAKTASEAMKAMKRAEEGERNREKAAALGRDFLGSKHTLHNGEAEEWMIQCDSKVFDVICTDPPYGMGADEFGDSGGGAAGAHGYNDSYESWLAMLEWFVPISFRITKPDAHLYAFCDLDNFHFFRSALEAVGWLPFRTPLLWYKASAYRAPWPEHGPQRKYECILYARKGDLKCTKLAGDVMAYPPDENLGHAAQKPVALYQDLLSRSIRPGMRVLDPFAGTGPIFPAAHALSAIATGVERDPGAYGIAAGRLESLKEGA